MEKYIMTNPPIILVAHAALPTELCNALIDKQCDVNEDLIEYTDEGVECYPLIEGTQDHSDAMEWVEQYLPWDDDFGKISNMQLIRHGMETSTPWMCDDMESGDTGKVIFNLNEGFVGGNLTLDGHTFISFTGSMVAFNNSTERWHGIDPVLTGERFSLVIRFTRSDNYVEPENIDIEEETPDVQEPVLSTPKVILRN